MPNSRYTFRAWDEGKKVMHYDFQFISSGIDNNDWIDFISDKKPANIEPNGILFSDPYFYGQLRIMQYTGINDVNGVPLYEGDVVAVDGRRYTVFFSESFLRYRLSAINGDILDVNPMLKIKIIGNIYEGLK